MGPVGANSPGIDLARTLPVASTPGALKSAVTAAAGAAMDVSALRELSAPDLTRLLGIIEPVLSPQDSAHVDTLLQNVISAAAEGDISRALDHLTAIIHLDPRRAETVRAIPDIENIRVQVDQLVARLQTVAKLDAEGRLGHAARAIETGGAKKLPDWDISPELLLLFANRLFDAGGYVQYVRASAIAQVLIDAPHWAPAEAPTPAVPVRTDLRNDAPPAKRPSRWPGRLRALWRRAPLLILLLAWLALGLIGGSAAFLLQRFWPENANAALIEIGFDAWGLGFLVLVLFGFYMRVRNIIKSR